MIHTGHGEISIASTAFHASLLQDVCCVLILKRYLENVP